MIKTIDELGQLAAAQGLQNIDLILQAARTSERLHSGQFRASGDPYFIHPLQVTEILVRMGLDDATVIAGLLHDIIEDTLYTYEQIEEGFGEEVANLVEGVTKIDIVKAKNKNSVQAETIRKMLFAMVKDIRVILIKLADKLHNMRTLEFKKPDRIRAIAQECLDIYAPLAGRLGISWMKDELEDLSLKHLQPEVYQQLKAYVKEKKSERSDYLQKITEAIETAAAEDNITVETRTRAKHFYSIYSKMRQRGKSIDEIYDLLGVRILCNSISDCYIMLGNVHKIWMPIEGRFKDYIAMPKANRYQSLHTTVMGYDGRLLEIQIRTFAMEQTAQFGVAAHWQYKKNQRGDRAEHQDLTIINRLRDMNNIRIAGREFLEEMKREILKDTIYLFTPKGDVIQLPKGATALDFAYHIHTEVGHHTSGAKADGAIVPLKQPLKNTQVVEIITHPSAHPHLEWLRYVKTRGARSKIRAWINKHDESLFVDQNIVARKKTEPETRRRRKKKPAPGASQHLQTDKLGIRVGRDRNLMIHFANCCNPKTGDDIVGYVSRGRGIIIHRRNCKNFANIKEVDDRTIEVEWETVSPKVTRRFRVTARRTGDLFSEIEGAVRKHKGHLIEGKVDALHSGDGSQGGSLEGHFTMELDKKEDISRIVKNIRSIPSILSIQEMPESDPDE
jgi:guanosine-3',5'-bis(diphosphate) 3'-pyrophosphohydrolase